MQPEYVLKNFKVTDDYVQGEINGITLFFQKDGWVSTAKLYKNVDLVAETIEHVEEQHKIPELRAEAFFDPHEKLKLGYIMERLEGCKVEIRDWIEYENRVKLERLRFDFDFAGTHYQEWTDTLGYDLEILLKEHEKYRRICFDSSFIAKVLDEFWPLKDTIWKVRWQDERIKALYEVVIREQERIKDEIVGLYWASKDLARAGNLSQNPLVLQPILQRLKEKRIKPEEFVSYLRGQALGVRSHMTGGSSISAMFRRPGDRKENQKDKIRASNANLIDNIANTIEKMVEEGVLNKEIKQRE